MARDPMDPSKEDPNLYYEGRLYAFHVEEVIKEDGIESDIKVNHSYGHNETYTDSDAVVDELGIVQREATWSKDYTLFIKDPLFSEPQKDTEYILFLLKNDDFSHYYGAIEPFMIRLKSGKADLQTNLTREKEYLGGNDHCRSRLHDPRHTRRRRWVTRYHNRSDRRRTEKSNYGPVGFAA